MRVLDIGAGDEARTRYLHLGKVALYRMSYTRIGNMIDYTTDFKNVKHYFSNFKNFLSTLLQLVTRTETL